MEIQPNNQELIFSCLDRSNHEHHLYIPFVLSPFLEREAIKRFVGNMQMKWIGQKMEENGPVLMIRKSLLGLTHGVRLSRIAESL